MRRARALVEAWDRQLGAVLERRVIRAPPGREAAGLRGQSHPGEGTRHRALTTRRDGLRCVGRRASWAGNCRHASRFQRHDWHSRMGEAPVQARRSVQPRRNRTASNLRRGHGAIHGTLREEARTVRGRLPGAASQGVVEGRSPPLRPFALARATRTEYYRTAEPKGHFV